MKRASYRDAVDFIAMNDNAGDGEAALEEAEVIGYASVLLVASIFGVEQDRVARDVVRLRERVAAAERRAAKVAGSGFAARTR